MSLLSCGREVTGPGAAGRRAEIALNPVFGTFRAAGTGEVLSIGTVVDFAKVRVVLLRSTGDTVVDRLVDFPPDSASVNLAVTVTLGQSTTAEGEPFAATLKYINATGDTVFSGGPVTVIGKPAGGSPVQPPAIPITYVGTGANAASIAIAPKTVTTTINQAIAFSAVVRDQAAQAIANTPVAYTAVDSTLVRVNLRTGAATALGARGTTQVIAQTLTGQADTATVTITPTASAMTIVSGNAQSVRQGSPFPLPARVRVTAVDAQPVAGVPVVFAVARGQGTAAPAIDTTDAQGLAEATWTAGDSAGVGLLNATVQGTSITAQFTGTQLSSAPTALTFGSQPTGIAAGASLPLLTVVVRDATADTVRSYTGPVTLTLSGGTVGASLIGTSTVNAVGGVATFEGLTVDRAGTAYRLNAAVTGVTPVQSSAFDVTPSLPAALVLVSGGGQSVPPGAPLPDSIVVRVVDVLTLPKAGVTVNFSVTAGGGSVSAASATTDANGRAAVRWTAGAAGSQALTVSSGALTPLVVNATAIAAGGPPVLFLSSDGFAVPIGRQRVATIYLTNPAPAPITVRLAMRDAIASWAVDSLVIPIGASSATAVVNGLASGSTWAVATSDAGNDSLLVSVDSLTALIAMPYFGFSTVVSDTIRTVVRLSQPAPVGGVVVTVRSTDSSAVLLAPGTGLGAQDDPCGGCYGGYETAPTLGGALLAPPSGTATLTVPAGQSSAHLVVLPVAPTTGTAELQVTAPGHAPSVTTVSATAASITGSCYYCEVGPGQGLSLTLNIPMPIRRPLPMRVRSLDPAVATVRDSVVLMEPGDTYAYLTGAVAAASGTARIVTEAPGFLPDTTTFVVRTGGIGPNTSNFFLRPGDTYRFYVGAWNVDANGQRTNSLYFAEERTMTMVSRNPSVVSVESGAAAVPVDDYAAQFAIHGQAAGSTWVVFSLPGYATDSVEVFVERYTMSLGSATQSVGLGMRGGFSFYPGYDPGRDVAITTTSSDPNIVRVLQPSGTIPFGTNYWYFEAEARALGTAVVTAGIPGVDSTSVTVNVVPPELGFYGFTFPQRLAADSTPIAVQGFASVGGVIQIPLARTELRLRSTDPSVLLVSDSIAVIDPSTAFTTGAQVRAVGPGTAQLILAGPGFVPDTSAVVTVDPRALQFSYSSAQAGTLAGVRLPLERRGPTTDALPVSFTVRGPSGVTIPRLVDTIPAGEVLLSVLARGGATVGTDTVIVSAAGYAPDTFFVAVSQSAVDIYLPSSLGGGESFAFNGYIQAPVGQYGAVGFPFHFRVVSRDTTVVRVEQDSLDFLDLGNSMSSRPARLRGVGPGGTWVVVLDRAGVAGADSAFVAITMPRLYGFELYGLSLPMQSRTYDGQVYVARDWSRPSPVWVRLTSSAPSLVTVPDSVLIPADSSYTPYDILTGDSTGSALVTMSAPGYSGGSFPVYVTRGRLVAGVQNDITTGNNTEVLVYNTNLYYDTYAPRTNVPLRMRVLDTTRAVAVPDTGTMVAGIAAPVPLRLRGVRAGATVLKVEDTRTGSFAQLTPLELPIQVAQAELRFYEYDYWRHVAPGTRRSDVMQFWTPQSNDSTWVKIRSLRGRARIVEDSVLMEAYDQEGDFTLQGITAGVDTLVVEAPGYRSDSITVTVGTGLLKLGTGTFLESAPPRITVGDSLEVRLALLTATEEPAVATVPLTATLTLPAGIEARVDGVSVTSLTVPVGAGTVSFWLRATAVGSGPLTFTMPGHAPLTYVFSSTSP